MDGNAVFEMFHYSENIRKQKQLMGKKPLNLQNSVLGFSQKQS